MAAAVAVMHEFGLPDVQFNHLVDQLSIAVEVRSQTRSLALTQTPLEEISFVVVFFFSLLLPFFCPLILPGVLYVLMTSKGLHCCNLSGEEELSQE